MVTPPSIMVVMVSVEFAKRNLLSSRYPELWKASIAVCFEENSMMTHNFQPFPSTVSASISLARIEPPYDSTQG